MFNNSSPLENLKAFGIAYAAGILSTALVRLYVRCAKESSKG